MRHQKEALIAISKNTDKKSQIIIPTGGGKTRIQIARLLDNTLAGKSSAIFSHRLILNKQLFDEAFEQLEKCELMHKVNFIFIGSDKIDNSDYNDILFDHGGSNNKIFSVLNPDELSLIIARTKKEEKIPIFVSTYHSCGKLKEYFIDEIFCDESHVLTGDGDSFFKNISMLNYNKIYFFTATPIYSEFNSGIVSNGMNNEEFYGKRIYYKTHKELVDGGVIVPAKLHVVTSNDIAIDATRLSGELYSKLIIESFETHEKLIKIGPKLLVCVSGNEILKKLADNQRFKTYLKNQTDLNFCYTSSLLGSWVNGVQVSKSEFLKKLKEYSSSDKLIVAHINQLTEGIDVPGITGILPMFEGEIKNSKLMQSIGRATRLHNTDREFLNNNPDKICKWEHYVKPCAWIILPNITDNSNVFVKKAIDLVYSLRNFDIAIEFTRPRDILYGIKVNDENYGLNVANNSVHKGSNTDLTHKIETDITNIFYLDSLEKRFSEKKEVKPEDVNELISFWING